RHLPGVIRHDRLDVLLELFGEFFAGAREHFDAVVLERIVRRRNHDAGGISHARRQVRNRRRRNDAGTHQRRVLAVDTKRQLALDPPARFARVAAGQKARPAIAPGQSGVKRKRPRERSTKPTNSRRIEGIGAGLAAHTVRAEQTTHRIRTFTSAGSSRTTPTRAGATTVTGSWKSPV